MRRFAKSTKSFFRVIFRNRQATVGFIILSVFLFTATIGALLTHLDMTVDFANRFQMPSLKHWLGTDYVGRDIWAQLVHGSRDVIALGVIAAVMALGIGIFIGAIAGFSGGGIDTVLNFITNVFMTIPSFPLMLILAVSLNVQNIWTAAFILAIVSWGGVARVMRGQVIALKYSEYVYSCRILGLKTWYIVFREIIPNTISMLAIQFIGLFQNAINASMGLMLLGAMAYKQTNWGVMLSLALQNTGVAYNPKGLIYFFSPIVCLGLLQLGCIYFSSGVDEALNPTLRTE